MAKSAESAETGPQLYQEPLPILRFTIQFPWKMKSGNSAGFSEKHEIRDSCSKQIQRVIRGVYLDDAKVTANQTRDGAWWLNRCRAMLAGLASASKEEAARIKRFVSDPLETNNAAQKLNGAAGRLETAASTLRGAAGSLGTAGDKLRDAAGRLETAANKLKGTAEELGAADRRPSQSVDQKALDDFDEQIDESYKLLRDAATALQAPKTKKLKAPLHGLLIPFGLVEGTDERQDGVPAASFAGPTDLEPFSVRVRWPVLVKTGVGCVVDLDVEIATNEPGWARASGILGAGRLGADLDNLLKTICDGLRFPGDRNANPDAETYLAIAEERPFYCLFQDDALVRRIDSRMTVLLQEPLSNNRKGGQASADDSRVTVNVVVLSYRFPNGSVASGLAIKSLLTTPVKTDAAQPKNGTEASKVTSPTVVTP